jgi:hypothetical protein
VYIILGLTVVATLRSEESRGSNAFGFEFHKTMCDVGSNAEKGDASSIAPRAVWMDGNHGIAAYIQDLIRLSFRSRPIEKFVPVSSLIRSHGHDLSSRTPVPTRRPRVNHREVMIPSLLDDKAIFLYACALHQPPLAVRNPLWRTRMKKSPYYRVDSVFPAVLVPTVVEHGPKLGARRTFELKEMIYPGTETVSTGHRRQL